MTRPWQTLSTVKTPEGPLELRQRGDDEFLIVIAGRVLMTSRAARSEELLAMLACDPLARRTSPHILIGGLGMAFTLRAALDSLPPTAEVTVAELTPEVATWCKGPLAPLTQSAALDPRVTIKIDDVAHAIAAARRGYYDAIILDLYEGPHAATQRKDDPFYGAAALVHTRAALAAGGVFAVWSEDPDDGFLRRLGTAGFKTTVHKVPSMRTHVVYLAKR
jgi:spermidine synthase